jgi:type IV pilus assembly protein PilC
MTDFIDFQILVLIPTILLIGFLALAWKKPGAAIVILPFLSTVFIAFGLFDGVDFPVFVVIGIILIPLGLLLIRLAPVGGLVDSPWYRTLAGFLLGLLGYGLLLAVSMFLLQGFGPGMFALILSAIIYSKKVMRYGLAWQVLNVITAAIRLNLPLPMALNTAAQGAPRREKIIFLRIAHWLTQGLSLSDALKSGYPKCPTEILSAFRAAEQIHQIPDLANWIEGYMKDKTRQNRTFQSLSPLYPIFVTIVAILITYGLLIFIVPTFATIAGDMSEGREPLPVQMQFLIKITNLSFQQTTMVSGAILIGACLLLLLIARFRHRQPEKPRAISILGDGLKWFCPGWGWFEKMLSATLTIQTLTSAIKAGFPITTALRQCLLLDTNWFYRKKLIGWLNRVEQGQDIAQSARSAGMGASIAWAFDSTMHRGDTPMTLETLGEIMNNQYRFRSSLLRQILWPVQIVLLGCLVGFIVYTLFSSMVNITHVIFKYYFV